MSRWAVVGVPDTLRHGGDLRASHLFRNLIDRTNALSFYRPDVHFPSRAARHLRSLVPGVNIAAAELLPQATLPLARRLTRLRVLDLHDHPVHQMNALQVALSPEERHRLERLTRANLEAFERVVVISDTFADLSDVHADKRILIPNGTDTAFISPQPLPSDPVVGFISGASPGRGIELLLDAMEAVHSVVPEIRLALALSAPDAATRAYLASMRRRIAGIQWASIETVPYSSINSYFARTSVLAIPHARSQYMDSALPVKLFDSMAAQRPVIATPRLETKRVLDTYSAGVSSKSDSTDDFADALLTVVQDTALAMQMGERGRRAAVEHFDWRILATSLGNAVLG